MHVDPLKRLIRRLGRDELGAGALEFALIAPVLIFSIVAVLQLSIALYKGSTVQWVSERALRTAMIDDNTDAARLQDIIRSDLAAMGENLDITVNYQVDLSGDIPLGRINVTYQYPVVLPLLEVIHARFEVDTSIPISVS